jgi:hypothetical protein
LHLSIGLHTNLVKISLIDKRIVNSINSIFTLHLSHLKKEKNEFL